MEVDTPRKPLTRKALELEKKKRRLEIRKAQAIQQVCCNLR